MNFERISAHVELPPEPTVTFVDSPDGVVFDADVDGEPRSLEELTALVSFYVTWLLFACATLSLLCGVCTLWKQLRQDGYVQPPPMPLSGREQRRRAKKLE